MGPLVVQLGKHPLDAAARHGKAEMFAGDVLDHVGLVEDDDVVVGQQLDPGPAQRQVGKVERVVDDEHLGMPDPPPRRVVEALLMGRAAAAHAIAGVACNLVPHGGSRQGLEIGPRAVAGLPRPGGEGEQFSPFSLFGKQAAGPLEGEPQPPQAHVVAPPFDEHRRELAGHDRGDERNVLGEQLLLERDRVRGDHHPPRPRAGIRRKPNRWQLVVGITAAHIAVGIVMRRPREWIPLHLVGGGGEHGGHEVGQALADPSARLDDRMPPLSDRAGHEIGHRHLLGPRLPARQPGGQPSVHTQ